MLRDITLGQYYPAESVIHKLDPRVKIMGTFLFIISVFLYKNIFGIALATIFLVSYIGISKIPLKYMVKGLKPILIIMVITAVFNLFLTPGEVLWKIWIIKVTKEGIINTGFMILRLTYLVIGTSLMTLTTTPNRLTDGLEKLLRGLRLIKVPVHEVAMMMSIALRFIPILVEETDKIMKAQMARGADFESGNLLKRAKNMIPLLVPLFISSWKRAMDLAMAMEARCYRGGEGRTKMKPLKYVSRDYITYGVIWLFFIGMILIRIFLS